MSLINGLSPLISSIRLTTAKNTPLNNAKKSALSIIPVIYRIDIPIYQVRTIAIPPPLGVGISCKLLSLGITSILFLIAYLFIRLVNMNERMPRINITDMRSRNFKISSIRIIDKNIRIK
jgi:hypothetical protein